MHGYRIFYKFILSRRYNIELKGVDVLDSESTNLILPNHVSHIDPQIMTVEIYKHTDFVPLVAERFFKIPIIKFFLRRLHAVKIPEFKNGSKDSGILTRINTQIIEALKNNKSAMIFPSGQLSSDGIERILNKQSSFSVVSLLPDNVKVIGVRITGLWGSMFSKAWNGKRPIFLSTFLLGIVYFFANLIFFCPKRKVTVEFIDISEEAKLKAKSDRKTFNKFLENFYNENGPEKPTFIRHLFFFPRIKNKIVKND
ncbi:MAG: lysophospholipid acyltransferase family protein [Salinivirgaceae bacterium]|jgi:1-acyl-sn-glycerol-3-phosphate acyltransferase|nr:lysophospholipid acyltransferase family protein [Salinivirgaceae bacterium]